MHPVENIRGTLSHHLDGRHIVLGVCGSIAAVKTVELARELIRHGASVTAVMTDAATRIIHPEALHFATGRPAITRLTGAVEHVALLGDVPQKADLLLIAPATANSVTKIALGIDDSPVTTCATVALGTNTPIVVAPAMHEAMLDHAVVTQHLGTLRSLGIGIVDPAREEHKAKLADVDTIVEHVIQTMANAKPRSGRGPPVGPLAGRKVLVVSGATAEPLDPVRILTNRSSGLTGILLATELGRLGADVTLWQGHATATLPDALADRTTHYATHADLMALARGLAKGSFGQVWMPAAVGDYAPAPQAEKIPSDLARITLELAPLPKVIEIIRKRLPKATLVAFKAESDAANLEERARARLKRYKAQFIVANTAQSFGATTTTAHLLSAKAAQSFSGDKATVAAQLARAVATS